MEEKKEMKKKKKTEKSICREMPAHVNRALRTRRCLIAKLFYHGAWKRAAAAAAAATAAAAASRQIENRSSAIYRDCQRSFEQSFAPSAGDSFCRIFGKSGKASRLGARARARAQAR